MSKNAVPELEKRVARLEEELRLVKAQLAQRRGPDRAGWESIVGSFEGDEAFHQIVQEGRKIREADRQRARIPDAARAENNRTGMKRKAKQAR